MAEHNLLTESSESLPHFQVPLHILGRGPQTKVQHGTAGLTLTALSRGGRGCPLGPGRCQRMAGNQPIVGSVLSKLSYPANPLVCGRTHADTTFYLESHVAHNNGPLYPDSKPKRRPSSP